MSYSKWQCWPMFTFSDLGGVVVLLMSCTDIRRGSVTGSGSIHKEKPILWIWLNYHISQLCSQSKTKHNKTLRKGMCDNTKYQRSMIHWSSSNESCSYSCDRLREYILQGQCFVNDFPTWIYISKAFYVFTFFVTFTARNAAVAIINTCD